MEQVDGLKVDLTDIMTLQHFPRLSSNCITFERYKLFYKKVCLILLKHELDEDSVQISQPFEALGIQFKLDLKQ